MDWIRADSMQYCRSWPRPVASLAAGDPTPCSSAPAQLLASCLSYSAGASTIILANYVTGDALVIAIFLRLLLPGMTGLAGR
jgi:hypothetical protein